MFFNSSNSHDIASKLIVARDRINVLTMPRNYYLSSIFFLSAIFWEFLMLEIFINNNSFLESSSKFIFKDTGFAHNPPLFFGQINRRLIFLTFLIILIHFSHIFLKTLKSFFLSVLLFEFNFKC